MCVCFLSATCRRIELRLAFPLQKSLYVCVCVCGYALLLFYFFT